MTQGASPHVRLQVWLSRTWPFLVIMVLAVYFGVMAGRSVYESYQDQQETKHLEDELKQVKEEKERLQALLTYYKSDAYAEKELRRTMLLHRPGETVYALPESSALKKTEEAVAKMSEIQDSKENKNTKLPIWKQWVEYLFR